MALSKALRPCPLRPCPFAPFSNARSRLPATLYQIFYVGKQRMALSATKVVVKQPSGKTVPPEEFFVDLGWDLDRLRAVCTEWAPVVETVLAFEASLARAADGLLPSARL